MKNDWNNGDLSVVHPAERPFGAVTVKCRCTRTMTPVYELGRSNFRCGCGLEVNVDVGEDYRTDPKLCQLFVDGSRCGRPLLRDKRPSIFGPNASAGPIKLGDIGSDPMPGVGLICDECALSMLHGWADDPTLREYFLSITLQSELAYWRGQARKEWYDRDRSIEPSGGVPTGHVVYYVRLGQDHIKIGTTGDLNRRMRELRVANRDNLLAVERGTAILEKHRHKQFAAYRFPSWREDFHESEELLAHIELLRDTAAWRVDAAA